MLPRVGDACGNRLFTTERGWALVFFEILPDVSLPDY